MIHRNLRLGWIGQKCCPITEGQSGCFGFNMKTFDSQRLECRQIKPIEDIKYFKCDDTLAVGRQFPNGVPAVRRGNRRDPFGVMVCKVRSGQEAAVLLHMKYSKLKEFLGALYKNPRVPFLDPKSVEFGKIEDSVKDFSKFVRQQTFQSRSLADAAEAAGELAVQEPLVKVRLDLVALDWKRVERVNDDSDGSEDEDE